MKYAICLYGQPRNYKYGYNLISEFIKKNDENTYDFFFHCWIDDNWIMSVSPWRKINKETLYIENQEKIKNNILELYKPYGYEFEKPIDKNNFDIFNIKDSLSYKNMKNKLDPRRKNIYNIFCQICSRTKVKDLLQNIISNENKKYDMVISTRLDGFNFPKNFKLNNIKKNKIYVSSIYQPRLIIPDNFLVVPTNIYLNWFNLYSNIKNIINNKELEYKINNINEKLIFNMESIILLNYLYCGYDMNDIIFDPAF